MAMDVPGGRVRQDYGLRCSDPEIMNAEFSDCGFLRIAPGAAGDGDMLLVHAGPAQLHVAILTPGGYLHADARVRKVVEVPGPVPWPILSVWRHPEIEATDPGAPAFGRRLRAREVN